MTRAMFRDAYGEVFDGDSIGEVKAPKGETYGWDGNRPMCATRLISRADERAEAGRRHCRGARILALFGDKITTDHISPAGAIKAASPAGKWLQSAGVGPRTSISTGRAAAITK